MEQGYDERGGSFGPWYAVMERVYLLLGTNLGDKQKNLEESVSYLSEIASISPASIIKSTVYESEPWGFDDENMFLNQVISFETTIDPENLLVFCKKVEEMMGRDLDEIKYDKEGKRVYKSRIIDLDILLYGDRKIDLPHLKIPHSELYNREFALTPLNELLNIIK